MKKSKFLLAMLAAILCFSACSDHDDPNSTNTDQTGGTKPNPTDSIKPVGTIKQYEYLDATSYTKWVYFSFKKGEIIEITTPSNDLTWDIAFHRGDLKLNGGESGIGKGEAINTNKTDWSTVTEAPTSGYVKDKVGTITVNFTGTGIEEAQQSFSQTLATWLTIDTSNPPPVYTYHNYIYVIKTADGKFVKLQINDYKDAKNKKGAFISFKYQYNESGTNKFYN